MLYLPLTSFVFIINFLKIRGDLSLFIYGKHSENLFFKRKFKNKLRFTSDLTER